MDEQEFLPQWFGGRHSGGALRYTYREPLWRATTRNPDYYAHAHERLSQAQALPELEALLADRDTVVEIGPGTTDVVTASTLPLLARGPGLRHYEAVDILEAYARDAAATVGQSYPSLTTSWSEQEAFEQSLSAPSDEVLFVTMGLTIANLPWADGAPGFVPWMARLFHDHPRAMLLTSFDNNLDPESNRLAYAHETTGQSFLAHAARALSATGFNAKQFTPSSVWDLAGSQIALILEAKTEARLRFREGDIVLPAGWRHVIGVSIRLSDADFRHYVGLAGARVVRSFRHPRSRISVYLIGAAE